MGERKKHHEHERRESIGEEFAEHHGPIGTGADPRKFMGHVFGRKD